jgi:hypothetical protein
MACWPLCGGRILKMRAAPLYRRLALGVDRWQRTFVSATAVLPDGFSDILGEMSRRNVETTLAACDQFRRWHRTNFILEEPSAEQRSKHANDIRVLLMTLRWVQATVADPGTGARDLLPRVETMIRLLEDCWQNVHEPIDEAAAQKLLAEVFPE